MIIGHKRILNFLEKSIEHERLSHAYLFSGPAHLGKKAVASEFVKMLTGIEISETVHPDILIIEPQIIEKEGVQKEMEIGIPQIREAQRRISLFACQSSHKIAIINQADRMTREASNCLLKTLEEPTGGTVLILITSSFQSLLPTIVSRCQLINFLPVAGEEIEKGLVSLCGSSEAKKAARLANGRPGLAIEYCKNPKLLEEQNEAIADLEKLLRANFNERCQYAEKAAKNTPEARRNLGYWTIWFRDLLLSAAGCADLSLYPESSRASGFYSLPKLKNIIQAIRKTDNLLSNSSINARLSLEVLMMEF
ncbi:hypothetical protein KKG85_00175 [Patescibacteria group bacterium]|nr:hypothetical protein [Patescibacteria group bacterium]MBU2579400.1 hypothetical protein [Patescibacteria group bacterium]